MVKVKQTGRTNLLIDKLFKARLVGKRISKRGKVYYEYRKNRSDVDRNKKVWGGLIMKITNRVIGDKKAY